MGKEREPGRGKQRSQREGSGGGEGFRRMYDDATCVRARACVCLTVLY